MHYALQGVIRVVYFALFQCVIKWPTNRLTVLGLILYSHPFVSLAWSWPVLSFWIRYVQGIGQAHHSQNEQSGSQDWLGVCVFGGQSTYGSYCGWCEDNINRYSRGTFIRSIEWAELEILLSWWQSLLKEMAVHFQRSYNGTPTSPIAFIRMNQSSVWLAGSFVGNKGGIPTTYFLLRTGLSMAGKWHHLVHATFVFPQRASFVYSCTHPM